MGGVFGRKCPQHLELDSSLLRLLASQRMRLLRKSRSLKELQKLATMMSTCFKVRGGLFRGGLIIH